LLLLQVNIKVLGAILLLNGDESLMVELVGDVVGDKGLLKLSKGMHFLQIRKIWHTGSTLSGELIYGLL
jgi:hypothetical protein